MRRKGEKTLLDKIAGWAFWCLCGIILFIIFLTLVQCSVNKPSAPSWNSRYNLPLLVESYDMRTLVEKIDDPAIRLDSLGNPGIYIQKNIDTIWIKEDLDLAPLSKTFKDTIGEIPFTSADTQKTDLFLSDIYGGPGGSVPPFSYRVNVNFPQLNDLQEVSIRRGTARLKIENHMGVDLDSFSVELVDSASRTPLTTIVFESGIKQDSTKTKDFDLSNKSFSSKLAGNNQGHSPGGMILILGDKYISFSLTFPDTVFAYSATAKIPPVTLLRNQAIGLPTSNIINSAQIKNGNLYLHLENLTNLPVNLSILLPELTSSGAPLSLSRHISTLNFLNLTIPLTGYTFQPTGQNINIEISGQTEASGENLVSVNSSDSISVSVSSDTILFSSVSGIIQPTIVQIDPMQLNLDLPQGLSSVSLTDAVLDLRIKNGVGFPGYLDLNLNGEDGQTLLINGGIESGAPDNPVISVLRENNLTNFLNPVPVRINLTGQATCGDGITSGRITENDFICGEMILSSPFEFVLDSASVQIDPNSNSLQEELRNGLEEKVNSAKIYLDLENHLPIGAKLELFFSRDSASLYTSPELLIGPALVNPALIDSSGLVTNPVNTELVVQLNKNDLQVFQNLPFYTGGRITFQGTDGQKIKFLSTDYIQVRSHLELEVKNGN
ncbi:MAG TPA: hypothetical protein VMT04_10920 [Terriglobales bacterium]|nr:hypothetical protein [Terriglobales bacterium]